jgi:hypothetical protein
MTDSTDEIHSKKIYLDTEGHELEKGFYGSRISNGFVYFTGEYSLSGDPLCEFGPNLTFNFQGGSGEVLDKINEENIKKRLEELKENVSWIEKKLKE